MRRCWSEKEGRLVAELTKKDEGEFERRRNMCRSWRKEEEKCCGWRNDGENNELKEPRRGGGGRCRRGETGRRKKNALISCAKPSGISVGVNVLPFPPAHLKSFLICSASMHSVPFNANRFTFYTLNIFHQRTLKFDWIPLMETRSLLLDE